MPNITKKSGLRYYTSLMKGYFEELFNVKVDSEINMTSTNPVQNKAIAKGLAEKLTASDVQSGLATGEWLPLRKGKGENSIVEGGNNASNTNIEASHVEGYGNVIRDSGVAKGCHAEGRYVMPVNSAILLVGVGARTGAEANAYVVTYNYGQPSNGYMYVLGVGGYDGGSDVRSAKSLQEVIKDHETDIAGLKTIDMSQYSTTNEIKKNLAMGEWLPLQKGEGEKSVVIGNQTSATGQYAFASGLSTQASGMYSHAEGVFSIASGNYSHAEGSNAKPKGEYSHAEGERTEIASQGGHAEGVCTYLNTNEDVIHHVGVGYYNDKLSTDVILRKYGDAKNGYQYMIGIGGYDGKDITSTTKSLQEVIKELGDGLAKVTLNALTDRQNIGNNTTAIATANTTITANTNAINTTNTRIDSATTRISTVESSLNAMNATRLDIITSGGSADEPVPVWTDSTRHDVTQKKRTQTFTGFTNIDVSNDLNANTDAAARLRDRRSWISSIRLRNFSGTKLTRAFMYCGGLRRLDTSTWDMSRLTTLRSTFHGCVQLEDMDTSHWDTHSVTDMGYTFSNCTKMRSFDVRAWDTSAVTSMDGTFNNCTSMEELDLSGWDMSQVQTVESMFNNCGSLRRLDIRYWDLSRCSAMAWFLSGCGAVEELYLGEGFGKVLNAVGSIDLAVLTKWTGDSVQTLLYLFNRTAHSSEGFRTITLRLSSQTKAALGSAGIQTLTSRGYTIA